MGSAASLASDSATHGGRCARAPAAQDGGSRLSPQKYRIDVTRYAGDTFQFHAFYRSLREALRPLIGWTASPPFAPRSAPPPDPRAPYQGAAGSEAPRSPRIGLWSARRLCKVARSAEAPIQ